MKCRDAAPAKIAADSCVGWQQHQPWSSDHMCERAALTSLTDIGALPSEQAGSVVEETIQEWGTRTKLEMFCRFIICVPRTSCLRVHKQASDNGMQEEHHRSLSHPWRDWLEVTKLPQPQPCSFFDLVSLSLSCYSYNSSVRHCALLSLYLLSRFPLSLCSSRWNYASRAFVFEQHLDAGFFAPLRTYDMRNLFFFVPPGFLTASLMMLWQHQFFTFFVEPTLDWDY